MMADQQNSKRQATDNNNFGVQLTSHPIMLIMIKGNILYYTV